MKPEKIAHITKSNGNFFVTVYALMIEGHYHVTSHAPFSSVPKFPSEEQARSFIAEFGVSPEDIVFAE